ncbi:hypothetical protein PY310_04445 [Pseudarthrobacter sp. H3Y2-7]|uniref:hypothetical protein n=1 Tax=Pseudarthrobacter naphthalenicus TaxID=3031328 RepID=UPI0023B1F820|nr:hypothetical protein [Pseudarthrobacter sp. H3Y2-7]MDE8667829.1 hypothetical protein [Pseudarthrobacter sp. H3Y2-7]
MESLVIPVIILAVVAGGVALAAQAIGRRQAAAREAATAPAPDASELARLAAAKLNEEQHRKLYALIAQGQAMAAIKFYYESTGEGLRAARDAVGALAAHPQPFRGPQAEAEDVEADDDTPQRFPYRYRAIASKGDVTREVSSNMLNDEIYGRIRTLARSGDIEGAATALTKHSDISMKQAREFIALLDD